MQRIVPFPRKNGPPKEKYCFKCHHYYSHTLFDVVPRASSCRTCPRDHLCHTCRVLTQEQQAEAEAKKQARIEKRRQQQRSKHYAQYNLSREDYDTMFAFQHGRCAICNDTMVSMANYKRHMLYVDHDHTTGKVRGLLCTRCNQGLGFFRDAPHLLARARTYLLAAAKPTEQPEYPSLFDPPQVRPVLTSVPATPTAKPAKKKKVVDYHKLAKLLREVKAKADLREKKPPLFPKRDT